jgi:hypothetical protein
MRTRDKQAGNAPSAREDVDNPRAVDHPSRSGLPGVKIKDAATGQIRAVRFASRAQLRARADAADARILYRRGHAVGEVARMLGVSRRSVFRWISTTPLPPGTTPLPRERHPHDSRRAPRV